MALFFLTHKSVSAHRCHFTAAQLRPERGKKRIPGKRLEYLLEDCRFSCLKEDITVRKRIGTVHTFGNWSTKVDIQYFAQIWSKWINSKVLQICHWTTLLHQIFNKNILFHSKYKNVLVRVTFFMLNLYPKTTMEIVICFVRLKGYRLNLFDLKMNGRRLVTGCLTFVSGHTFHS